MLILRKPWNSQPQEAVSVNPDLGLTEIFLPSIGNRGLVSGVTLTKGTTQPSDKVGVGGRAFENSGLALGGTSNQYWGSPNIYTAGLTDLTIFALFETFDVSSTAGYGSVMFEKDVCGFQVNHANSTYRDSFSVRDGAGAYKAAKFDALLANTLTLWVGTKAGGNIYAYTNGVLTSTTACNAGALSTPTNSRIMSRDGGYNWNGRVYLAGYANRSWSDSEVAEFERNPWQLFAPRSIYIPVPAAGGATDYPVTITEAATAADSCSAIVGYATTATEAGSAADTVTSSAAVAVSITEAAAAADTQSAVTAKSGTVTEPASAADAVDAAAAGDFLASLTEPASATDTVTSSAAVAVSITEPASATDTVSATAAGDYAGTVTETASAADTASAVAAFLASLTEPATAADTVSGAGAGAYTGTIDEAAAATDLASAVYAYLAGVSEVASAADLQSALAALSVSITEAAAATDTVSVAGNAEPLTNAEMQQLYAWMQQLVNERHLTLPQFLALK